MAGALVLGLLLAEGVSLIREVAAEDDRVRPHVPNDVGCEVRLQGGLEALTARERGEGDVVLGDLPQRLMPHALQFPTDLFLALVATLDRLVVEIVGGYAPLEERGEDQTGGPPSMLLVSDANSSTRRRPASSCSHGRTTWKYTPTQTRLVDLGDRPPHRPRLQDGPQKPGRRRHAGSAGAAVAGPVRPVRRLRHRPPGRGPASVGPPDHPERRFRRSRQPSKCVLLSIS